jgi:ribosomal protein S18 acetylase RimI-like enzyme
MRVAALTADDAPAYCALMLQAYARDADAFTSTAQERAAEPAPWWVNRIAAASGLAQGFGAFDGPVLTGAVALEFSAKPKTRHSALVVGMVVQPEARRQGTGRALMLAAIAHGRARPGLRAMRLTVTEGNAAAIGLYAALGFRAWGVEPMAIAGQAGGLLGKVHMVLDLAGG